MKNIVFYGKGPRLINVINILILEYKIKPKVIFFEKSRIKNDKVKILCNKYKIDYFNYPKKYDEDKLIKKIKSYNKKSIFLCGASRILSKKFIENFNNIYNCHAGKLPEVRGSSVINWAIINNHKNITFSVHKINEIVDRGILINQTTIKNITSKNIKDIHEISYKVFSKMIYEIITKNINLNKNLITKNNKSKEIYYWSRSEVDSEIYWPTATQINLHNFIRSLHPLYPAAYIIYKRKKYFFLESKIPQKKSISSIGKIVKYYGKNWYLIGTLDYCLKVKILPSRFIDKKINLLGKIIR